MKIEEKFKKVGYVTLRNFVDTEEFYEYCLEKNEKRKGCAVMCKLQALCLFCGIQKYQKFTMN